MPMNVACGKLPPQQARNACTLQHFSTSSLLFLPHLVLHPPRHLPMGSTALAASKNIHSELARTSCHTDAMQCPGRDTHHCCEDKRHLPIAEGPPSQCPSPEALSIDNRGAQGEEQGEEEGEGASMQPHPAATHPVAPLSPILPLLLDAFRRVTPDLRGSVVNPKSV